MRTSDTTGKLMAAIAKAQAELTDPRQAQSGHHGTYASLADGLPGARRVLSSHGIALLQSVNLEEKSLTTRLAMGGEWIEGDYPLIMNHNKPQQQGANTTYARRYALWAFLALAPEDDDGQQSSDNPQGNHRHGKPRNWHDNPPKAAKPEWTADKPRDPGTWDGFKRELEALGWSLDNFGHFLKWSGGKSRPWELSGDRRGELLQKLAMPDEAMQKRIVAWEQERGM